MPCHPVLVFYLGSVHPGGGGGLDKFLFIIQDLGICEIFDVFDILSIFTIYSIFSIPSILFTIYDIFDKIVNLGNIKDIVNIKSASKISNILQIPRFWICMQFLYGGIETTPESPIFGVRPHFNHPIFKGAPAMKVD